MIKNFPELHSQLEQLAPIINSFKSEAVQLRIVELVFSGASPSPPAGEEEQEEEKAPAAPSSRRRKRRKVAPQGNPANEEADGKKAKPSRKSASGRPGPGAIVATLLKEGFFSTGKGAAEIIDHCRTNKVLTYDTTEISVALGRAVKAGSLKREKNTDGQYRYSAA